MDDLLVTRQSFNRVTTDFLKVDIRTALTFTRIASQSEDPVTKWRNRRFARNAYDTVLRLLAKVELSESDARILADRVKRLKSELRELGETF